MPNGVKMVWNDAHRQWCEKWRPRLPLYEFAQLFNKRFNESLHPETIALYCRNNGIIAKNRGQFKKQNQPWNTGKYGYHVRPHDHLFKPGNKTWSELPVWSYRKGGDGKWLFRFCTLPPGQSRHTWIKVAHLTWMDANNQDALPPHHIVVILDGNEDHCLDPNNVFAVSRSAWAVAIRRGYAELPFDRDIRRTTLVLSELIAQTHRAARSTGLTRGQLYALTRPTKEPKHVRYF